MSGDFFSGKSSLEDGLVEDIEARRQKFREEIRTRTVARQKVSGKRQKYDLIGIVLAAGERHRAQTQAQIDAAVNQAIEAERARVGSETST